MSLEGEIDLDNLIKRDKEDAKKKKFHPIKKDKKEFHKKEYHHNRPQKNITNRINQKYIPKEEGERKRSYVPNPGYALSVNGFITDVSIDDIFNLAGERKITNIKTMLRKRDRSPLDPKEDIKMEVIITFPEKEDANSFINDYSDKMLDGKYSLTFSFVEPTD